MAPTINKTVFSNGLRILTQTIPHVHSVSMGVWVNVGARDETLDESGLSHFIEHMIFKGTRKRTAYQIAKEFDAIGGQTNAFTSMENTCYHAKVLDSHVATMVDILSDIFLNSLFHPDEVEKERPIILQEISMVEDTPEEYVHTLMGQTFWGEHPLGRSIIGNRQNIQNFDADMIRAFFGKLYQPDRIVISAAGNLEHQQLLDLIGKHFESLPGGKPIPARTVPEAQARSRILSRELEQVHFCLATPGLKTTDPQRFAFSVLNTIMGGNMSSRLFQEIRERKGLAYSVYSFINSHVDSGMFGVYAGVSPQQLQKALDLVLEELSGVRSAQISSEELNDAKEFMKGSILLSSESTDNQMVRLAQNEIHFERYIPLQEVLDQVESVAVEDIHALAQSLFSENTMALTLLGPVPGNTVLKHFPRLENVIDTVT